MEPTGKRKRNLLGKGVLRATLQRPPQDGSDLNKSSFQGDFPSLEQGKVDWEKSAAPISMHYLHNDSSLTGAGVIFCGEFEPGGNA
jgi:hypothetical protein